MQELEKVMEEIEQKKEKCLNVVKIEMDPMEITIHREQYKGLCMAEEIIRNHMNDGWIPVEERLPEVNADIKEIIEDDDCPEYNVTIRGASESTTLKYSPDGTWFDDNGYIYDVIAWRPMPEVYRPADKTERSEGE